MGRDTTAREVSICVDEWDGTHLEILRGQRRVVNAAVLYHG